MVLTVIDSPDVWIPESTFPGFREFTTKFYAECWKSSEHILRALALGLGLPNEQFLLKYHDESRNELSLRHYLLSMNP
jgi:isopenicillin N synthase-like dioxygenase